MRKRTRESAPPDITPLIDVVFLLLIFFMVSTVFKKEELALLLNLPKNQDQESTQQKDPKSYTIEVSAEAVAINGKKMTFQEADDLFANVQDKAVPVELRIDKDVVYQKVVDVLSMLKKRALTNLNLITEK